MPGVQNAFLRNHGKRIGSIAVILGLFTAVHASIVASPEAMQRVAGKFDLSRSLLTGVPGAEKRHMRFHVHPDLQHIDWYVSSLGASVALNDLDGDGLPNDVCYVETRTDQVIVAPAPGTPQRYPAFALHQDPFFDRSRMAPTGCIPGDANEDGYMDLAVIYAGRTPVFYMNRGARDAGPLQAGSYVGREPFPESIYTSSTATFADLDGDGHLDFIVGNYFADGSDIYNPNATNDVYMNDSFSNARNGGGIHIFRWSGASRGAEPDVRYTEITESALPEGVGGGWTLAVGAQDLDGDLLPELYQANDHGPDHLFHNRSDKGHVRFASLKGEGGFTIPKSKVLGRDSFKSMGVDFGDLNGDAIPDIYVSNVTNPIAFQESQFAFVSTGETERMSDGIAPYIDESTTLNLAQSGWCWDVKLTDLDNDSTNEALETCGFIKGEVERWAEYQELGAANDLAHRHVRAWPKLEYGDSLSGDDHNPFFAMVDGRYEDISGLIGFREPVPSRGIAIADVDGNGTLDMAVGNMWDDSSFYSNASGDGNGFLGLHLLLPVDRGQANDIAVHEGHPDGDFLYRYAVGAQAEVTLPDGRSLVRQVDGGNGFAGRRDSNVHFGLGRHEGPVTVTLRWRDQTGEAHQARLSLSPGWHTVNLGWSE